MKILNYFKSRYSFAIVLFIVVILLASLIKPNMVYPKDIIRTLRNASILGIMAIGLTFVVISRGIDLSIGAVFSLSSCICSAVSRIYNSGTVLCIIISLMVAGLCGFINGLIITRLKIKPFIATLGTMIIYSSISISLNQTLRIIDSKKFDSLYWAFWGPLAVPTVLWLALFVVALFILRYTYLGRFLYAIGDSKTAVIYMGVKVARYEILAYVISAIFSGIAGILSLSRNSIASGGENISLVFDAITVIVLGGVSLNGARGTLKGVLFGTLSLVFTMDLLNYFGIYGMFQGVLKGLIFLAAASLDKDFRKRISKFQPV